MLCFWNHLINMSNDRLTKYILNTEYTMNTMNTKSCNWCSEAKQIFAMLGLDETYM